LLSSDRSEFSAALAFCFENLFDRFGPNERLVIDCLSCARKPLTSAELRFLAPQLTDLAVESALSALHNSSLVSRNKSGQDNFEYSLSESAQKFIATSSQPSAELFKAIQKRLRELRLILTTESILEARYEYDPNFVRVGAGRDERIAATYLRRALDKLYHSEIDEARKAVQDARRLAPNSAEAWRISALIEERSNEFYNASECYEQAIQLDPASKITRYCYAQFLVSDIDDLDGALEQFDAGLKLSPEAPPLLQGKANALTRAGRLDEATKIHEMLLPVLHTRERRWRLIGTDQAADCFRRVCFRYWEQKEFFAAKAAAKRALQIILDAALKADLDQKLLRRAAKVINEALSKRELVSDLDFVEYVLTTAEKLHDHAGGASIPVAVEASWAIKNPELSENTRRRLQALDRDSSSRSPTEDLVVSSLNQEVVCYSDVRIGTIHNVSGPGNFAFIQGTDGRRWFFHRNFLRDPTAWARVTAGTRASFSIGQNYRGECAINVDLLSEN
jgi:LuxR family glucitol operon transcriptional activator